MLRFEDMSNDLILYVWEQLTSADVIFSFLHLNIRLNSLLREFRDLYQQLDLRFCSLPASRFFCRQVPTIPEWQHGLTILKLGNRYRCSQLDFFADEVIKSVVVNHFAKQGKSCNSPSKDIFRVLMTYSKHIQPIFPQLISLVIYQSVSINEDCRDTLLYVVAGGSTMRRFTWNAGHNQTHHSRAFFDWLFRCSLNLLDYQLIIPSCENGFELTYEHTIIHGYVPHHSLINLKINILNLSTLYVLLHYLPQLEHLGRRNSNC